MCSTASFRPSDAPRPPPPLALPPPPRGRGRSTCWSSSTSSASPSLARGSTSSARRPSSRPPLDPGRFGGGGGGARERAEGPRTRSIARGTVPLESSLRRAPSSRRAGDGPANRRDGEGRWKNRHQAARRGRVLDVAVGPGRLRWSSGRADLRPAGGLGGVEVPCGRVAQQQPPLWPWRYGWRVSIVSRSPIAGCSSPGVLCVPSERTRPNEGMALVANPPTPWPSCRISKRPSASEPPPQSGNSRLCLA